MIRYGKCWGNFQFPIILEEEAGLKDEEKHNQIFKRCHFVCLQIALVLAVIRDQALERI